MDKTTITEVAAGTALVCGGIDNAINSRRIKRLEKEAIKQRKKVIAGTAIGSASLVSTASLWLFTKRSMKKIDTDMSQLDSKIEGLRKDTAKAENVLAENLKVLKDNYGVYENLAKQDSDIRMLKDSTANMAMTLRQLEQSQFGTNYQK